MTPTDQKAAWRKRGHDWRWDNLVSDYRCWRCLGLGNTAGPMCPKLTEDTMFFTNQKKAAWYRERAESEGLRAKIFIRWPCPQEIDISNSYDAAREAAHWGRMALQPDHASTAIPAAE